MNGRFSRLGAAGAVATGVLLAMVPMATGAGGTLERVDASSSTSRYVPGEVLVGFRAHSSHAAVARAESRVPARAATRFGGFRMELVKLARGVSVRSAIRRFERDPAVAFAEPNYVRYTNLTLPTDGLFGSQWDLHNTAQLHPVTDFDLDDTAPAAAGLLDNDIDAPLAWPVETHGSVVAVIDTGVDVTHPDLAGQFWTNPGEIADDGVDNDGNGKVDDVSGWDFANNDKTLLDAAPYFEGFDHGTHVSGTIAAALDGTTGIVGVCPACKIMVLKVARDSDGLITDANLIAALAYAKSKNAKIANLSLGGASFSNALREALRTSGLLAVVAAGNDSLDNDMSIGVDLDGNGTVDVAAPSYPAAFSLSNVLSVAASNHKDENAYMTECYANGYTKPECAFTNWGHDSVDLSAPGVDITSTVAGGGWETWDGTSMAAPHVAGVAGLVLAHNPTFTVAQLKNAIMNSADRRPALHSMFFRAAGVTRTGDFTRTSARVNALTALTGSTANATTLTDGNIDGARSMTTAKAIGGVRWPDDTTDVRKRKLLRGHTYRVKLVVPAGRDFDLFVWKPGTKEIWQWKKLRAASARGSLGLDEIVQFRAGSTGVYYIQVSAWIFNSGTYTLSFARIS